MAYARAFFDLQITFAERAAELTGLPLERALFEYTNLYVRFGFGRAFDPEHAGWREYVGGLGGDTREWTYRFYLRDPETTTAPPVAAWFGGFAYARVGDVVRLHFRPTDEEPFHADRRHADLTALFRHLDVPNDTPVVGASWLYNLDAYRRLFPAAYTESVRVVRDKFRSMPLWGQFVDRRGRLKESMSEPFLASLASVRAADRLGDCFAFQVLTARAPARAFYDFFA